MNKFPNQIRVRGISSCDVKVGSTIPELLELSSKLDRLQNNSAGDSVLKICSAAGQLAGDVLASEHGDGQTADRIGTLVADLILGSLSVAANFGIDTDDLIKAVQDSAESAVAKHIARTVHAALTEGGMNEEGANEIRIRS